MNCLVSPTTQHRTRARLFVVTAPYSALFADSFMQPPPATCRPPPPPAPQDGKRQSAYQAKMHLSTLARKVKTADAVVGCPGHERIYALLHTVEGVLAELKSQEASAPS